MASRFTQGSKYKHITGQLFKREEQYLDLNLSTIDASLLAVSAKHVAALWSTATNGSVGVLPLTAIGKRSGEMPLIHGHSASILDMSFSPFDDDLLVTAGEDAHVRAWRIPDLGLTESVNSATTTLSGHQKKVEVLSFNPAANNVVATGSDDKTIKLWDLESGTERSTVALGGESASSISWSYDGSTFAYTSKEKKIRVVDPRANAILSQGEGHQGVKAARVVWLGDLGRLATTGFSKTRERQLGCWDVRNLATSLSMTNIDTSTGVLVPLYDNDAKLLFLGGKGDTTLHYYEVVTDKAPFFRQIGTFVSDVQQRDIALLPKRAVDVWETEVDRVFKATPTSIVPVRFTVPRKVRNLSSISSVSIPSFYFFSRLVP
jgi:WD40 repeat protein